MHANINYNSKHLPILVIANKRPGHLKNLLTILENINLNNRVYIFIDGPKDDSEKNKVLMCQVLCENSKIQNKVIKCYQNNLGCAKGPIAAINWLFEHEETGVIIEEDCVPVFSFFYYCLELLDKYYDDERIYHISGNQFDQVENSNYSYFFSKECHCWGWATWKRAWKNYDYHIIPASESETIWDFQWQKTILKYNALTILPAVNLVKNLGYGIDATHTTEKEDCIIRETAEILTPLKHPIVSYQNLYVTKSI